MIAREQLALHHIGIAVAEIAPAAEIYLRRFGYDIASPIIHDPRQTAYVQFLRLPQGGTLLELVAPDSPTSKLAASVQAGGGPNHLCYAAADINQAVSQLRETGMIVICEPVAAVAFAGRKIAWLLGRDRVPIEVVENGEPGQI